MASNHPDSYFKVVQGLIPKDYGNTAPSASECANIDTKGFRWATCIVNVGNFAGTSMAIKISQDTDSAMGSVADVTGATFTTVTNLLDNQIKVGHIDLSKTERYLEPTFTFDTVTAAAVSVVWVLSNVSDSLSIGTDGTDAEVEFSV